MLKTRFIHNQKKKIIIIKEKIIENTKEEKE